MSNEELIKEVNEKLSDPELDTLENRAKRFLENTYPINSGFTSGLISGFGGSDIIGFFDGDIPELLDVYIDKKSLTARFVLGTKSIKIALGDSQIDFYLIGVNERGHCGVISGTCITKDFSISMGVDQLSTDIVVYFDSKVDNIEGWVGVDTETNNRIKNKFLELRTEQYKQKGLVQ